jgi:hypothetical protein
MKYTIYILVMIFSVVPLVYAESGPGPGDHPRIDKMNERREIRQEDRMENRQEFKDKREGIRNEFELKKDVLKGEVRENKEEWRRVATRTPQELKTKIEEMKGLMKNRREEIRSKIASTTEERKLRLDDAKKDRINERINNISGKFDGAVARMEGFDKKLGTAIAKFKEKGSNTSSAESLLVTARESLTNVKSDIAAFLEKTKTIVEGDEVSRLALKEEVEVVIQSIKDTHAAYVAVVVELRASNPQKEDEKEVEGSN